MRAAYPKRSVNDFTKWLNVVSDAKFVPGSEHLIASRDYIYTKLWDIRKGANGSNSHSMIVDTVDSAAPLYSAQVTDYLSSNLSNLLSNDSLDD